MLEDSRPDVVVGAPGLPASARRVTVDVSARGDELPEAAAADDEDPALDRLHVGHDRAAQGRRAARRAVASNLDALADAWAWTADDVLVHGLPLFHVHGLVSGCSARCAAVASSGTSAGSSPAAAAAALARRRDDAVRRPDDVPPARARGRRATPRSPTACARARLLVSGSAPLPGARVRPHRGAHRAADRRALRAHRDADEHGGARRRAAPPGLRRRPGRGRLGPAGRRRRRRHRRLRRRDDRRGRRPRPEPVLRLPQPPRRDRGGDARRLVLHRRPRHPRAGRLLADRRPARRRI